MATKIYVIGINIDTDYQSFGDVEEALDKLDIDYELKEEYTMYADTCDICGEEIEEGGSHYREDENEHICEDCYLEWLGEKPSESAYDRAEQFLIQRANEKGWNFFKIEKTEDYYPYGLKLVGYENEDFTRELDEYNVLVNVKDYEQCTKQEK